MKSIFYTALIIATLSSTIVSEKAFDPYLTELRTSDYGNEIASTIQVQLESQGNIQIVVDMVYSIRDAVREEKLAKDQEHEAENDRCLDNRSELMSVIDTAQVNQQKYRLELQLDEPLLQFRIEEKARKEQEAADRSDMIERLEKERQAEMEAFEQMKHEHEMVRMMIEQAREIMRGLLNDEEEGAFLQVETNKMASTFKAFGKKLASFKVKENSPSGHYNTIFKMLIKMAERAPKNAD